MKTLCIYHGHCDDGFAAAWAVRHALGDENVEFYPGVYQKDPPDVTGREVILVDFSYKRPVLLDMAAKAISVLVLDHHKTAEEDLSDLVDPFLVPENAGQSGMWFMWQVMALKKVVAQNRLPIAAVFDMTRSGAGLAWDFFHPNMPRPDFINYIEDRDLWRKSLPMGDEFTIALRSYPQSFDVWDGLVKAGALALADQGVSIQRYYRLQVDTMKKDARLSNFAGHQVMVSNSPYFAASEIAGELAEGMPFGASFFERGDGMFQYSLRSRNDGVDVSEIAKKYGGGGHRNAAGFASRCIVHDAV